MEDFVFNSQEERIIGCVLRFNAYHALKELKNIHQMFAYLNKDIGRGLRDALLWDKNASIKDLIYLVDFFFKEQQLLG